MQKYFNIFSDETNGISLDIYIYMHIISYVMTCVYFFLCNVYYAMKFKV